MRVRGLAIVLLGWFASVVLGEEEAKEQSVALTDPYRYLKVQIQDQALESLRGRDKFVLRQAWWSGELEGGQAKLVQVQLFRRNSYQFWMGVPSREVEPQIRIYDSEGNLLEGEIQRYGDGNVASIEIQPERSGVYYVRLALDAEIEADQKWAMIYAYR